MVIGEDTFASITFATVKGLNIGPGWIEICPSVDVWDILDKDKKSIIDCIK